MRRLAEVVSIGAFTLIADPAASLAQSWPRWADDGFGQSNYHRPWQAPDASPRPQNRPSSALPGGGVLDGGARPGIAPVAPPIIAFPHDFPANSIVIDTGGRALYYVLGNNDAYRYPIAVGREGFNWTGTETISRKQEWPDWYPPAEMRQRDPSLPEKMTGGLKNPLGAMALYLGTTLYRIHGTNDAKSIGQAQSSGCFRMLNSAILHLASIADIGATVHVVSALPPARQVVSRAPQ
jgi:lipoprotein-anchoring transpeptidase ErfK/SrfK